MCKQHFQNHHFPANTFSESTTVSNKQMLFLKEREKRERSIGLQYSRLEGRDIKQKHIRIRKRGGRISQKQQSPQTVEKPTHRRSQNPVKLQTVSKGLQPQTRSQ